MGNGMWVGAGGGPAVLCCAVRIADIGHIQAACMPEPQAPHMPEPQAPQMPEPQAPHVPEPQAPHPRPHTLQPYTLFLTPGSL